MISIHTALAGCDPLGAGVYVICEAFQSTQPSQAVTSHALQCGKDFGISIHTALAGCDVPSSLAYRGRQ